MWEFIHHQLQTNQFFSAGIVVSALTGIVFALKKVPGQIFDKIKDKFIFTATIYQTDPLYDDFEAWFLHKYKGKYRNVEAISREIIENKEAPTYPGQSISNPRHVTYKQIRGLFFIRYKGHIIHINKNRDKLDHTSDLRSLYMNHYQLSSIRGAGIVKELLEECLAYNANKEPDTLKIYTHSSYGDWYVSGRISAKDMGSVILPPDVKQQILTDIKDFQQSKDWYKKASIFYKRGHLYHGVPGNGKTSLLLAIASFMGRDLYCLDLNTLADNEALKRAFSAISGNGYLSIEDIDGFYNLREAVKKDSKISFSTFLNCLDGAFYKEGLFTGITTNKLHLVDAALMRNGRMDKVIEIPQPGIDEVNQYLKVFYDLDDLHIDEYSHNFSMCDIQEICLRNKNNPYDCLNELQKQKHLNLVS